MFGLYIILYSNNFGVIMINKLRSISLGNWILIGMVLGLIFGLILNFYVHDPFIKNVIFMDNVFYLGGNLFIKLMKMLVVPLVFCSIVVGVLQFQISRH